MTSTEAVSTMFVPYGQGRGRGLDAMELGAHGAEVDRLLIRLLASTSAGGAGVPADLPGLGITAASAPALDEIVGSGGAVYDVFAAVIRYVGEHGCGIPGDDFA